MKLSEKILSIALAAAVLLGGALFFRWLSDREDRIRMQATLEAQGKLIAEAEDRQKQRDAELQDVLKKLAEAKQRVQTPQQVVREITKYLPLPQPITIAEPAVSSVTGELEPPKASIPQEDLKPLFDFAVECQECKAKLENAQKNLDDERLKGKALVTERDAAIKAARGGGFWSRLKGKAKWGGVLLVVGYVLGRTAR